MGVPGFQQLIEQFESLIEKIGLPDCAYAGIGGALVVFVIIHHAERAAHQIDFIAGQSDTDIHVRDSGVRGSSLVTLA